MFFDDLRDRASSWWLSMHTDGRTILVVLGVCGFFAVSFSFLYVRQGLYDPFMISKTSVTKAEAFFSSQAEEARELEQLKTKDTDGDGLSDYSETYQYGTSPYLADSDSDGTPDSLELAQGTDPNCVGNGCKNLAAEIQAETASSSVFVAGSADPGAATSELAGILGTKKVSSSTQEFIRNPPLPGTLKPQEIRDLLAKQDLAAMEELTRLTDPEVLKLYQAVYDGIRHIQQEELNDTIP